MKRNTLSLTLLLSSALVVPTIAMADVAGYNETADASVMPVEGSLQEENGEMVTTEPGAGNSYEPETITEQGSVIADSEEALGVDPANTGLQDNSEVYPAVTEPTDPDYTVPVAPEEPLADDTFQ